jgi:hypothetical protein
MNYYYMGIREDGTFGIAYVPKGTPLLPLPKTGRVESWKAIVLTLREGSFSDYLANDRAFALCSRKLCGILDRTKSEHDEVQWLPALVRKDGGEEKEYFILHLPQAHDVLDKEKTVFGPYDTIIKPVISRKLAEGHHVFTFIGAGGHTFFVSDRVRRAVQAAKCVGVSFERAAAAD